MTPVGVECKFAADGTVRVRRVQIDGQWLPVTQGRQWFDRGGRHVLIMVSSSEVREIVLSPQTMTWALAPKRGEFRVV